jgi:exosome complex component RRP41
MYTRSDRKLTELRKIVAEVGVIKDAAGSARFAFGNTEIYCAVDGPKEVLPKHLEDPEKAIIKFKYDMLPFSTAERTKPGLNRRDIEISEVVKQALEGTILANQLPKTMIEINAYVIQADAGTRTATLNAASLACASAGIPMKDLIAALAVGKVGDALVADLNKEEEDWEEGATDMPVAWLPNKEEILLLQLDGEVTLEEFEQLLKLSLEKSKEIYNIQKEVLRKTYESKS